MITIDVAVTACPNHPCRNDFLERVLDSLEENLTCTRDDMRLFVSGHWSNPDPKQPWDGDRLIRICAERGIELTIYNGSRCFAANFNHAVHYKGGDYTLLLQDDWWLWEPLDLSDEIDYMEANPEVDLLRYWWMDETVFNGNIGGLEVIDLDGPWPFGDQGQLRRRSFVEKFGDYVLDRSAEGCMLTNLVRQNAKIVVAPMRYFDHIGAISAFTDNRYDHLSGPNLIKYNAKHGIQDGKAND